MTYTIPRPTRSPGADFDVAVVKRRAARSKSVLAAARPLVMESYDAYGSPRGLAPLQALDVDDETCQELRSNYSLTHGRGPLAELRDELMASAHLRRCPLCSRGDAASLDHYLPKDKYPELSIFSLNLVPACTACNGNKRSTVGSSVSGRFIHPYFDTLPRDTPLYRAEVVIEDAVTAVYSVNPDLPPAIHANAAFHFEKLRLAELYSVGAAQELWNHTELFAAAYEDGKGSSVRNEARRLERQARKSWGIHSWRTILYSTLSASEAFCDGGVLRIRDSLG